MVLLALLSVVLHAQVAAGKTPSAGEIKFRAHCIGCHSIGCNRAGPKLLGIFGRKAGTVVDFASYTAALRGANIVWSEESLDAFLREPAKLIPGTSMAAVVRVDSAEDRRDIIAYLRRQDRSIDLCF